LQSSEFLDHARVLRPDLDPPAMTIKIWHGKRGGRDQEQGAADSSTSPALSLRIGRHDVLRKTIYGRLEGDDVVLALPDALLEVLPRNSYAFRDRSVLALNPATVSKLTVIRDGKTTILEPDRGAKGPNQWRMISPVTAAADVRSITQILARLSDLRAADFVADSVKDAATFGLDRPSTVVSWGLDMTASGGSVPASSTGASGTASGSRLRIGKGVPGKGGTNYASLEGQPYVFTLGPDALQALEAELHDTLVLSFADDSIRSLVFRLPERTLAFSRSPRPQGKPSDWTAQSGTDMRGIDLSRFNELVKRLAELRTVRFYQYQGPIPEGTGLLAPRLVLELGTGDGKPPHVLRIGESLRDGLAFAATGTASSGPVFFLPAPAWEALIQSATPPREIPDDPFAPL
jgi:hypothetical protein